MPRRARLATTGPLNLALILAVPLAMLAGCDSTDDAMRSGEQAAREASQQALDASKKAASELADETTKATKMAAGELADETTRATKMAAGELANATKSTTRSIHDDVRSDGELSTTAKAWLKAQAADSDPTIENVLVTGVQLAPVALEAAKVLADATDRQTVVEPIFQKVDDDPAKVDAAIGDMPRVQVVDDVTVGFKQLDRLDASTQTTERGYLVMWRHEDHLVGFVYRSTRTVDLDAVIKESPRLIRLTRKALEG